MCLEAEPRMAVTLLYVAPEIRFRLADEVLTEIPAHLHKRGGLAGACLPASPLRRGSRCEGQSDECTATALRC